MPLDWNSALSDHNVRLAKFYPDQEKSRFMVRQAGLDPDEIKWSGVPKVFRMHILEDANRRDKVLEVLKIAKKDFANVDFSILEQRLSKSTEGIDAPPFAR